MRSSTSGSDGAGTRRRGGADGALSSGALIPGQSEAASGGLPFGNEARGGGGDRAGNEASSFSRVPLGAWGKAWLLAALMLCALLLNAELLWRSRGFVPALPNTVAVWVAAYSRVRPRDTVILGSSRAAIGIDPKLLAGERSGSAVVQLAMMGGAPLPIFQHFAEQTQFAGTVIVEIMPSRIFGEEPGATQRSVEHLCDLEDPSLVRPAEDWLGQLISRVSVQPQIELSNYNIVRSLAYRHQLPVPNFARLRDDRFVVTDTRGLNLHAREIERERWIRAVSPLTPPELADRLHRMSKWRRTIESRGGRIVFVRINSCGRVRAAEAQRFPRREYFDRAAQMVGGVWLHFEDDAAARELECFDGSHLESRSARRYSERLAELLAAAGIP